MDIIVEKKVEKVIVTHGTDTMIETAEYIAQRLREANMTVVITGAFLPESFKGTDADFNVGVAIGLLGFIKWSCSDFPLCRRGRVCRPWSFCGNEWEGEKCFISPIYLTFMMSFKIFPHSSVGRSKEGTFTSMPNDVKQKT